MTPYNAYDTINAFKISLERSESYWNDFLESVERFVIGRKQGERRFDIINKGLQVFRKAPHCVSASLFLTSQENFEFEFRSCLPPSERGAHEKLFDFLVEKSIIGLAVDKGSTQVYSEGANYSNSVVVAPLVASVGIYGVALLKFESEAFDISQVFLHIISFVGGFLASALENQTNLENIDKSRLLLEQKVAMRTMDLSESKRELKAILDSVQNGILVYDFENYEIERANPEACRIIGLNEREIVGRDARDFFVCKIDDEPVSYNRNEETIIVSTAGYQIPVLRTTNILKLGGKQFVIESFSDITHRIEAENALKEAYTRLELKVEERTEELQLLVRKLKDEIADRERAEKEVREMLTREKELNELKTRFVSMVSHEFRTPLTVIKSAAQMVERFKSKMTESEREDYLKRVVKTVDIMTDLIENVVFIGKSNRQQQYSKPGVVDAIEFTQSVVNDIQLGLNNKRTISIRASVGDYNVNLDEKLLRLVLINLITNALKYSPFERPIEVALRREPSSLVISVKDYGIGIPAAEQEKIFDVFYRASNVGAITGTGLGLPVVMQSVQMMGGSVKLYSDVGRGSKFDINLPLPECTAATDNNNTMSEVI